VSGDGSRSGARSRGRRRSWLWLLALLTPALAIPLTLSTHVIVSPSMEPALMTGDYLFMLRDAVDTRPLARWDVVAIDASVMDDVGEDVDSLVKRVVGLPGEYVEIRGGDVFVGSSRGDLALARKPDDLIRRLLVPVDEGPGLPPSWQWTGPGEREPADGGTALASPEGVGWAFLDDVVRDGLGPWRGEAIVSDTALEVVVGVGDGVLVLGVREGADIFRARIAPRARGGLSLHHNRGGGVVARREEHPGLRAGQRVLLWNVDNGVRLTIDEEVALAYDYDRNNVETPGATLNNTPELGVEGGSLVIRGTRVLRDLHYGAQGTYGTRPGSGTTPVAVPPGHFFFLGDLSHQSRDGRHRGPVPLESIQGRPVARYLPLDRARWLRAAGVGW